MGLTLLIEGNHAQEKQKNTMNLESNESYVRAVAKARAMACYGTSASVCTKSANSDVYFAVEGVNRHLEFNVINLYCADGFKKSDLIPDNEMYQAAYGL
jgi:hypothetical protein